MDPVSSRRSERAHPCFLGSGMEGLLLGAAVRGPCRLCSGVAGAGAQAVEKPPLAVSGSQILR